MGRVTLGQMGALLLERRGARGVRETAKEIGVSAATLSRIENGKQPDLTTFEKICKWLDLDPAEVLGVDVSRNAPSALTPSEATGHLRAERHISPELGQALGEMIVRAQDMLADPSNELG